MDKINDYLTAVEEYLRCGLADENLSTTAQIKRRHLLDKFYALDLAPNVARKCAVASNSHNQSGFSLNNKETKPSSSVRPSQPNGHQVRASATIDDASLRTDSSDGFYEDPDLIEGRCTASSDVGSDTEYESYNDEEERVYANQARAPQLSADSEVIRLPRLRTKKKKKKDSGGASSASNALHSGYLYQKGMLSWTQRYCCISSDHRLLCYRSDRDSKPLLCLPLSGRDVVYTLRTDSRFNHALRVSMPGTETHWFYADGKDLADLWLTHLCTAAVASSAKFDVMSFESDDLSTTLKADIESSAGDNQFSQTNLSAGSSEGGSGDGIVLSASGEANTATLRKKSKIEEIGDSLHSLIGTLGKKKGDKIKRALTDVSNADSENTVLAGYVNINSESTGSKWVKRFCVAKRHRFDCYKDPLNETIEFSVSLFEATVELAHKRLKRELALRLVYNGKEILIEAFNETDYARWLNMLVRETSSNNRETADGIYDEVYNWAIYQSGDQVAMVAPPPPPLPRYPPPKAPPQNGQQVSLVVQARDENDYIEPQMVFDNMFEDDGPIIIKDDGLGLEEVVNSAFKHLREETNGVRTMSPVRRVDHKSSQSRSNSGSPASMKRPVGDRSTASIKSVSLPQNGSSPNNASKDAAVVKAHCGPTIDEDKELLEATQNPILIELRREKVKRSDSQERAQMENRLEELRNLNDEIKKKRLAVRGSLQMAVPSKKLELEAELQKLDREMEATERELTKLSFLAPQSNTGDRFRRSEESRRSFSTTKAGTCESTARVTRNTSFRETGIDQTSNGSHHCSSSASSSPLSVRRFHSVASSAEKRSSFSDISSMKSGRDDYNRSSVSKPCLAKTSSLSNVGINSSSSSAIKSRQSSTLPSGSRLAERGNPDKFEKIEVDNSSVRQMVQERLKLWESLSENRFASS